MKPGRSCTVCAHPQREAIDSDRRPQTTVARAFGVSPSAVQRHRLHAEKPRRATRKPRRGPPPIAHGPEPTPATPRRPKADKADGGTDARAVCVNTIARLQQELDALNEDDQASPRDRAAIATSLTGAARLLARMDGDFEITEAQILRAPAFRRVLDVAVKAIEPYPEVALAMCLALEKLEAEDGSA